MWKIVMGEKPRPAHGDQRNDWDRRVGNLPKLYWAEAINISVHLMNMSPTEALTRLIPEEAYSGIKPNVSTLKVFGCVAYMHIPDKKRRKLDFKSERCVFTGYDMYSKGYKLVNPDTNKIHISRDVIFDESDRWFKNTSSSYEEVSNEAFGLSTCDLAATRIGVCADTLVDNQMRRRISEGQHAAVQMDDTPLIEKVKKEALPASFPPVASKRKHQEAHSLSDGFPESTRSDKAVSSC
ncbi:hypothetical protein L7F22_055002 [Adiantum nelumboides]|nr:hypothetical protein [Adiantum nelumboides]